MVHLTGWSLGVFWIIFKQLAIYKEDEIAHLIVDIMRVMFFPVALVLWGTQLTKRRSPSV